ncbi:hypothetical protein H6F42_13840 [Pseudanabaena sp. FACHB-1998]|uniref:hypothetical protein n=1 Tax=Pseudanabaena sp. FACHB-1998 TaxID=2692858 RepID=UPI00168064B4|nr:hypothetical protein [Pseudanabaena sp. FACHB-1998]MBD2177998.1 hypothetical protein [Pseudanabaena sp. FACHB-1998]
MKFNLLAGLTLVLVSNSIAGVKAETITPSSCGGRDKCPAIVPHQEVLKPITPVKSLAIVESVKLPEGKISTVAALTTPPQGKAVSLNIAPNEIAQFLPPTDSNGNRIFRSNRSGPSYFGVGLNFGLIGGGNLGDRSLVILSKLGVTETLSVRPSVYLLGDFVSILIPVTYEFEPQRSFGDFKFSPYLGGGLAIDAGSNSSYGPLITAGVDIPLSSVFTINVAANLAFLNSANLGIVVGVGYNF